MFGLNINSTSKLHQINGKSKFIFSLEKLRETENIIKHKIVAAVSVISLNVTSILHRNDIEEKRGKLIDVSSVLKVE